MWISNQKTGPVHPLQRIALPKRMLSPGYVGAEAPRISTTWRDLDYRTTAQGRFPALKQTIIVDQRPPTELMFPRDL